MNPIKPYSDIKADLQNGKLKSVDALENCAQNLESYSHLNAFVRTYTEEAREKAETLDSKPANPKSKLHGMIVGLKDMFSYKAHPLQASSKILESYVAKYNSTAVQRLIDNDAIIIGHQNCDEFGMGSSNENSVFGPVRNMLDPNRVSGGSSGGSAVAVQTHMCHASLGTDTGGSVRQPAAFCGIVGFKPTYSRISRYGVVAYASSLDTVGIIAQTVADCSLILETIAGADELDSTVSQKPVECYADNLEFSRKAKIAYIKEALEFNNLQPDIKQNIQATINNLKQQGHSVEPVSFPLLHYALPTYYILANAEASSNLACYDGVRYGYRAKDFCDLQDMYSKTRSEGFGDEVKRRVIVGTYVLSAGYGQDWFTKAQKVRRLIRDAMYKLLAEFDFLIMPTTPTTAFAIGATHDPLDMYLADLYTVPASIAGVPAISIPNGRDAKGLPIGLQIISAAFAEQKLLAFANDMMLRSS